MKRKYNILAYSIVWTIAIMLLMLILYQNMGQSKVINYTGLIRGGTQQLVKQELFGSQNDDLITYLDDILNELQTGHGKYQLDKIEDGGFQKKLTEMEVLWNEIKEEILILRTDGTSESLYQLSELYFEEANEAVNLAEHYAEMRLSISIFILSFYLVLSISSFYLFNRHKEQQFKNLYYTDELTKAMNRNAFEIQAKNMLSHAKQPYAIISFDIRNFKYINDTYGYQYGDRLLQTLADYLAECLNLNEECLARLNADNFMLLVKQSAQRNMLAYRAMINEIRNRSQLVEPLSLCFGIFEIPTGSTLSVHAMMDKAQLAHKAGKERNCDLLTYYDDSLAAQIYHETQVVATMHAALEHEEFLVYIQPKFDVLHEHTISGEALVRWNSSQLGFLSPDAFIPIFEKNGFISELDFYMLKKVCLYMQESLRQDRLTFPISINISRVTLLQNDFLDHFKAIVEEYGIPHSFIEIELTESAFNGSGEEMLVILKQLKAYGFLISMDDFGSGYSSLNLLRTLPIDIVKLDREFIKEDFQSAETKGIVSCIVEMAHLLNIQVICEGIETKEQLDFLKSVHCDFGQGYYYARPLPLEDYIEQYTKQTIVQG